MAVLLAVAEEEVVELVVELDPVCVAIAMVLEAAAEDEAASSMALAFLEPQLAACLQAR